MTGSVFYAEIQIIFETVCSFAKNIFRGMFYLGGKCLFEIEDLNIVNYVIAAAFLGHVLPWGHL